MSIEYMRLRVAEAYDGDSWKKRVSRMPDAQVEAIYDRLLESGKIEPRYLRSARIYRAGTAHGHVALKVYFDECHDGTAYVSETDSTDRVRTDEISGQITFEDLK